jgi:hypothetical protein
MSSMFPQARLDKRTTKVTGRRPVTLEYEKRADRRSG